VVSIRPARAEDASFHEQTLASATDWRSRARLRTDFVLDPRPVASSGSTSLREGTGPLAVDRHDVLTEPPAHSRGLRAAKVLEARLLAGYPSGPRKLGDLEIDPDTGEMTGVRRGDQSMPADGVIGVGPSATGVVDQHY
jgi:hypothetical protein